MFLIILRPAEIMEPDQSSNFPAIHFDSETVPGPGDIIEVVRWQGGPDSTFVRVTHEPAVWRCTVPPEPNRGTIRSVSVPVIYQED